MIQIQNLTKSFGSQKVLNSLNLSISKGSISGIVGANGAGKSTLFNCISGMETFNGTMTSEMGNIRNNLAILPTTPPMLSKITGEEYLILHCNAAQIPIPDFSEHNLFNLPLQKYASEFSTGMKKKLALSAILLLNRSIIILDEPFNGVDLKGNMLINEIILDLKKQGKTILISSHIFSSLQPICDEIHFLNDGVIQASSTEAPFTQIKELLSSI